MRRTILLVLFWTSLVVFEVCDGAEWSKLKKCSDSGFCRRQRGMVKREGSKVVVDRKHRVWLDRSKRSMSALTGYLTVDREGEETVTLQFWLSRRKGGSFRWIVDDMVGGSQGRFPRYRVEGVLVDEDQAISKRDWVLRDGSAVLKNDRGDSWAEVQFDPWELHVHRQEDLSDEPVILVNRMGLFSFEMQNEKPTPSPTVEMVTPSVEISEMETEEDTTPAPEAEHKANEVDTGHNEEDEEEDYEDEMEEDEEKIEPRGENSEASDASGPSCDGCWEETFSSHKDPKPRGPEAHGVDIVFPRAQEVFGIPERTMPFSLPPTVQVSESEEQIRSEPYRFWNLDVFEFELEKPFGLYGSVPFLLAKSESHVSGVLWLNTAETFVDIANLTEGGSQPSEVFRQYLVLTGLQSMPPRFALGYHQCRWNYRDDQDTRNVDQQLDHHDIPYDVIWLDIEHTDGKRYFTWNMEKFPDPTKLQMDIAERGRKMVTIIDPHIKRDDGYTIHKKAQDAGHYVKNEDGSTDFEGWCWPGSSSYFDFTSPKVRDAWASMFNPVDYPHFTDHLHVWNDMNEPSVFNGPEQSMRKALKHHGGWEHRDVHNLYGMLFHQATQEGLIKARKNKERAFVLSRAFFAGSQRVGAVWTGDNTADWKHLRSSVPMILSLQVSGIMFSGADVGGFFGNPSPELLVRWYQAGAFQPFFRAHAHLDTARREPWLFGEENTQRISDAIRARYELLPFWYSLFAVCSVEDVFSNFVEVGPPMRPLWWHFSDEVSGKVEDQWMLGNSLLVAPIMSEGSTKKDVYLPPESSWYDLYGPHPGESVSGNWTMAVSMSRLVAFLRGGTIIPMQERRRRSSKAMGLDPISLIIAVEEGRDSKGHLYWDDGHSFNFQNGEFVFREFVFQVATGTLSARTLFPALTKLDDSSGLDLDKIVLYGFRSSVSEVSGPQSNPLAFTKSRDTLVIKKPGVSATHGTWALKILA